jgi:hypothetical protein
LKSQISNLKSEAIPVQAIPMKTSTRRMVLRSLLAASLSAGLPAVVMAGAGCCAHCGRSPIQCQKICRLKKEDRKITTTCWGMECEDFCVPGPSTPDCQQYEMVCAKGPEDKKICAQPKRLVWTSWIPGCDAEIFTKRKLMKKTVTKTVPSFKWVVEDACPQCIAAIEPVAVPKGVKIPPAPQIDGARILVSDATQ